MALGTQAIAFESRAFRRRTSRICRPFRLVPAARQREARPPCRATLVQLGPGAVRPLHRGPKRARLVVREAAPIELMRF